MAGLAAALPTPQHTTSVASSSETVEVAPPTASKSVVSQAAPATAKKPRYGQRKGWRPSAQEDFGDGGAYPECHLAQYPLMLGKKQASTGNTLALQVDNEGQVRYDVIATRGHREGSRVQATFKDTVPMALRTDVEKTELERPSEDEVASTTEKTKLALEKLVSGKISAAQPKNVPNTANKSNFVRYTPQDGSSQQRIIKMTEVAEDPLEPSRFRHKKVPRGPGSPPPPILRSPPRKATAQDQKDWMIPPCVSNWKNNKGYTIPLDKRLAADGRGLQDVHINDKFATFSESLYIADRHAREEVRQRAAMQQRIAEKEKEAKEESLRNLAQRAREQRTGPAAAAIDGGGAAGALGAGGSGAAAGGMGLGGYGSDSDAESGSEAGSTPRRVAPAGGAGSGGEDDDDDEGAKERDRLRAERRKEREREMRMSNMGTEQRARTLARAQNRDVSEKVALGLAKPTMSKESMLDQRLFNQEQYSGSFADDDAYNLYDKPLFQGSSAAAAIYKPMSTNPEDDEAAGNEEGIKRDMQNDRFDLGVAGKGFSGAADQERREGPVQFEKDTGTSDPFGVGAFLDQAKAGLKRGADNGQAEGSSRKKAREDDD